MATEAQSLGIGPETSPELYIDLVRSFPLRPIRSTEEHDRAIATVHALANRYHELKAEEKDYFLVLTMIVERYEDEIYPETASQS